MIFLALQDAAPPFVNFDLTGTPGVLGGVLICFLTLSVFSFLYKDNPFYKIAEHVFVGVGTAWFTMEYYDQGILQPIHEHIVSASELPAGELLQLGGYGVDPSWAIGFRAIALVLGVMLLLRLFVPNSWAPRWPLAIMVGVYASLKMTGETQSKLVLQVAETMDPIDTSLGMYTAIGRIVMITGLVCALGHFIFTFKRTPALAAVSKVGIITLMITFGSMFGFTVLGRIALLIERVASLEDYSGSEYALLGFGGTLTSPPILIGAIIVLGLLLLRGKGAPAQS